MNPDYTPAQLLQLQAALAQAEQAANDVGSQVVADRVNANVAYVVGLTSSANLPLANPRQSSNGGGQDSFVAKLVEQVSSATTGEQQTTTYSYDGLQRLVGAVESPGNSYAYAYDLVGNRTDAFRNGNLVERRSYDAADRVLGWSYDEVGNLLSDARSHTFEYDHLNRLIRRGPWEYEYNGDGLRVVEASPTLPAPTSIVTTWDLAAPLPEALRRERIEYSPWVSYSLYGQGRLLQLDGGIQTWYGADGLGSTRRTLNSAGNALSSQWYDPWGLPRNVPLATAFGFTGARQTSDGFTYLRAREYLAGYGIFSAYRWRSDESWATIPYSHHPYAYALSNPVNWADPTGKYCQLPDGSPCPQPADVALQCGQPGQPACPPPGTGPTPTPTRPNKTGEMLLGAGMAAASFPQHPAKVAIGVCLIVAGLALGAGGVAVQTRPQTEYVVAPMELVPAPEPEPKIQPTIPPIVPYQQPVPTTTPSNRGSVRVQLQEQNGPGNTIHHASSVLLDPDGGGVTVDQVVTAFNALRANPVIPKRLRRESDDALARALRWVRQRPPTGVDGDVKRSFYFNPQDPSWTWRFDFENQRGHNLKK